MVGPMGSSGEERMEKRMPLEEVVDWAGRVRRGRWQVEVLLSTTIWPLAYIIDLVNDDVDDDDVDDDVDSIIDAMFSNSERMGREEVEALLLLLLLLDDIHTIHDPIVRFVPHTFVAEAGYFVVSVSLGERSEVLIVTVEIFIAPDVSESDGRSALDGGAVSAGGVGDGVDMGFSNLPKCIWVSSGSGQRHDLLSRPTRSGPILLVGVAFQKVLFTLNVT
mmetsp:Transcript_7620/g.15806  ORF Transcript_7620/g.15806 Transcript_7620/m.15806 type:complete len:220 (-) Transcript_7620:133-792(-)